MKTKTALKIAFLLLLLGLGGSWFFGSLVSARSDGPSAPLPQGAQLVHIRTKDGVVLAGNFWPGKNDHAPAVLALHGIGSSRHDFDDDGADYAGRGYGFLAINLRAHGDAGGNLRSMGWFEGRDAQGAVAWLKARQHGAKVAVLGQSLGGAAALLGEDGPVKADAFVLSVVYPDIRHAIRNRMKKQIGGPLAWLGEPLLSYQSYPRYGVWPDALSPLERMRDVHVPVFIIGGEKDAYTPPEETRAIFAAANEHRITVLQMHQ